jgi:hypothetical protein
MAVNVVLPFLHAYAALEDSSALRRSCVDLYRGFPKLDENEATREMRLLLGARLKKPVRAVPTGSRDWFICTSS